MTKSIQETYAPDLACFGCGPQNEKGLRIRSFPADDGDEDLAVVNKLSVLLGDGIRFSPPGLPRIDLEPISSTRSRDVTILRFHVRT